MRKSTGEQTGTVPREEEGLRFLFRLDGETFLIGNARQLDAIGLSAVEDYVESEQLWSLSGRSPFLRLLVDDRSTNALTQGRPWWQCCRDRSRYTPTRAGSRGSPQSS
jgi:hypothetical protein